MAALVPKHRTAKDRPVTQDEKNIRWAVNKYVYSRKKNSLSTAYKLMLKEKYTDSSGKLLEKYPSFNQFRYWYSKNKKYMSYYIAREGKSGFMRNHRVLVGDNVQTFAAAPGVGMADKKGVVEKLFDIIQGLFKPYLKGAGVVAPEYLERGSYFGDYKEKSCLTLRELTASTS